MQLSKLLESKYNTLNSFRQGRVRTATIAIACSLEVQG